MREESMTTGLEAAVIGMSGRFPGAADIDSFWENIKNGVEAITFLADEELEQQKIDGWLLEKPNYIKTAGGVLEGIEYFDAYFFDYRPVEAEVLAPGTRIFHECLWEALEDAGYVPGESSGLMGLYTGAGSTSEWEALAGSSSPGKDVNPFLLHCLTSLEFLGTLISYKLDLKGPVFSLHTACSTSLVAIHLAWQGLLAGDCDIALAGGISVSLGRMEGYVYEEGMILSADGHCRAFDARAAGTVGGDGVGIVVLKRLEDAQADRDHVYALVKGSAINNDGHDRVGFTAPGVAGQAEVIRKALKTAGIKPEAISYIETHGTGTLLGDVTEIEALKMAFSSSNRHFCALGSVKSNVGHLDMAAGVTGFIKTVLALKHKQIPPLVHFETPNPRIDFEDSPFYVNTLLSEWKCNGKQRRAGVSSFGIGGTNAHVVLEEAPEGVKKANTPSQTHTPCLRQYRLILLSARSKTALEQMNRNLAHHLEKNPGLDLADVAYTLQVGRRRFSYRRKLVCATIAEAIAGLTRPESRQVQTFHWKGHQGNRPVIFMFPGLGSQYVNMGRRLYESEPVFRKEMDHCFRVLNGLNLVGADIKELLYPQQEGSIGSEGEQENANTEIHRVDISQLVVFIFSYALASLLMKWGIKPRAMMGYSFGEYTAACLAGVFSVEDALKLLAARGKLLQRLPAGMMLSVPLPEEEVLRLLPASLSIGIDNGDSCVVSGRAAEVKSFAGQLQATGLICMPLDSSHGLHSAAMDPIIKEFENEVSRLSLHSPRIPYISSVTGKWINADDAVSPQYWARQLRDTVQFAKGLEHLFEEPGSLFLEIGPGHDLCALAGRHWQKQEKPGSSEGSCHFHFINLVSPAGKQTPDDYYFLDRLGLVWLYSGPTDWKRYYRDVEEERYRISLPTYPFDRHCFKKLFNQYRHGGSDRPVVLTSRQLSHWFYMPVWKRRKILNPGKRKVGGNFQGTWLIFTDEPGLGERLAKRITHFRTDNSHQQPGDQNKELTAHSRVIVVKSGENFKRQSDLEYIINPGQYSDYEILFQELAASRITPDRVIHCGGFTSALPVAENLEPAENLKSILESGFYSLLYLVKALGLNGNYTNGISIFVITDHMLEVTGHEELEPGKALMMGLCRVIPQEYPGITCKNIDLPGPGLDGGKGDDERIDFLVEEVLREEDYVVAFRGHHRWVQAFEPVNLRENRRQPLVRREGVYVILGGLGEIGSALAEDLIKRYDAQLMLTGRTPLPRREMWNQYMMIGNREETACRAIGRLQELEKLGGKVLYCRADVADPEAMREVIRQAEEHLGPIHGVIHAADIARPEAVKPIANLTVPQCQQQFRAKLQGLLVLEELLAGKNLDFCLMISSISTILGGLGFAAYAAVNHFMDAFCIKHNRKKKEPWLIVDWDGTNKADTVAAFHRILSSQGVEQVIFSVGGDLEGRIRQWVERQGTDMEDHAETADTRILYSRPALSTPYEPPANAVEKKLAEIWQRFFGMEKIGVTDDLFDLGGDSLKMINIIAIIQKEMKTAIRVKEFFDNPTIRGAAGYIAGAVRQETLPIEATEEKEYYPLSSAQKRLYILQQMDRNSTAYNSPQVVELEGSLEQDRLLGALKQVIRRHESLRTSFIMVAEEPMQRVHRFREGEEEGEERGREAAGEFALEYFNAGPATGAVPGRPIEKVIDTDVKENLLQGFIRPFDLSRTPLVRAALIRVQDHKHILAIDIHHIIADGASFSVFLLDLTALYFGKTLPLLKIQYKDFSQWQNLRLQSVEIKQQETFWLTTFAGNIPVLKLARDFPHSSIMDFSGNILNVLIEKEQTLALRALVKKENTTLFMVLLAIYYVFLSRYTGQEDMVVGVPIFGRSHADLEDIMGMFVNMLAMRNYPGRHKGFREFLQEVKENSLKAFENQEYPFEELVWKLDRTWARGSQLLVDVVFSMHTPESGRRAAALGIRDYTAPDYRSLKVKLCEIKSGISKFDLLLAAVEQEETIGFELEYKTTLFKQETIKQMGRYLQKIVTVILENPAIKLGEIDILEPGEKERLIKEIKDRNPGVPGEANRNMPPIEGKIEADFDF